MVEKKSGESTTQYPPFRMPDIKNFFKFNSRRCERQPLNFSSHCHRVSRRTSLIIFFKPTLKSRFFILKGLFTSKTPALRSLKENGVLDSNSVYEKKKKEEFNFSIKLMSKLLCLINTIILDNVFSFKSSNVIIMNYRFEFDLITIILDNGI